MSIFTPVKKTFDKSVKELKRTANQFADRVENTADALLHGRQEYRPVMSKFLDKYGDAVVTHVEIVRNPIMQMIQYALNVVSGYKIDNLPFDKLFHLSANLTTSKGYINIQKNEYLDFRKTKQELLKDGERLHITVPLNISLNEFLNNGRRYDGDNKFFNYNASSANCQIWILGLLMGNGLNDPKFINFVKQDTIGECSEICKYCRRFGKIRQHINVRWINI